KPSSVLKVKVGNVFDFPNIDETRQVARQLVQTMLATKRNPNKNKNWCSLCPKFYYFVAL
ncbi:hypothetical protein ONK27_29110, partial [Salmonella enterica subsp. enterica serovar Virginia]|nr:hypothetical protein [Salmonella enterica subsp. enterica serovar Virginia]